MIDAFFLKLATTSHQNLGVLPACMPARRRGAGTQCPQCMQLLKIELLEIRETALLATQPARLGTH
jgi:hypothetical protein